MPLVLTDSTRGAVMRDRSLGHWRELRCPQGPSQCIAQPPPKEQVPQSEYANQPYAHACYSVNKGLDQKEVVWGLELLVLSTLLLPPLHSTCHTGQVPPLESPATES